MTLILVFMLLLAGEKVNAQPTQANSRAEEKQTNSQPSATPLDNRQTKIDNAANAASPGQNQERDAKDDPFKAEQLRQNRIIAKATVYIAFFGGLSFLAALIYAIVSIKQWKAIDKQTTHAGAQVGKMDESLTETRKLVIQNERAVKAAEDDAKTAREALYVGDAPYFGVTGIVFTDLDLDRYPGVDIGFMNGGRTPAWHFHATPTLIFGNNPESRERWTMQTKASSPANNFYPTGDQKTLEYKQIGFAYTEDHRRAITERTAYLFVEVKLSYQDRRKDRHIRTFRFAWVHATRQFVEFEVLYGY